MSSVPESSGSVPPRRRRTGIGAVVVLLLIVACVGWWWWSSRRAAEREFAAKAELVELGALVVPGSARQPVNSVNLSTLSSPDKLSRAVELLTELTQIQSLHVDGTAFGDEHAAVVGRLATLRDLALSDTDITDAALDKLQGLSRLDTLYLVDTGVTSAGIPALSRLDSLKILDLSRSKVTGNFEPLRQLTSLEHLLVQNLTLDAAAMKAFAECPALSRLSLRESTYPQEALDQLVQKRPGISVDR